MENNTVHVHCTRRNQCQVDRAFRHALGGSTTSKRNRMVHSHPLTPTHIPDCHAQGVMAFIVTNHSLISCPADQTSLFQSKPRY